MTPLALHPAHAWNEAAGLLDRAALDRATVGLLADSGQPPGPWGPWLALLVAAALLAAALAADGDPLRRGGRRPAGPRPPVTRILTRPARTPFATSFASGPPGTAGRLAA